MGGARIVPFFTAKTLLDGWQSIDANELLAEHDQEPAQALPSEGRTLSEPERNELEAFLAKLDANQGNDPKYAKVLALLREDHCVVRIDRRPGRRINQRTGPSVVPTDEDRPLKAERHSLITGPTDRRHRSSQKAICLGFELVAFLAQDRATDLSVGRNVGDMTSLIRGNLV